ncbi:MAG: nicotinate-nucleotide adenylyltransferase [Planctomycetaceae bacterium]|jgi:nicotinate-nucleotide adenylyltransferase
MKIGIFGGAFDPVHYGHLLLAEQCFEQCGLDSIWFIPTNISPHKSSSQTSGADRVRMLESATADIPHFHISRVELDREGISWTVDTLRQIRDTNPDEQLFLLIGADSVRDLPTWKEPETIAELATIVAVNRGLNDGMTAPDPDVSTSNPVQSVTMPGIAFSSTDIRQRVRAGQSIRFLVPPAVEEFIHRQRLYRS